MAIMTTQPPPPSSQKHPALNALRAIYSAAKAGSAIDPQAVLAATLEAVCAGADTWAAFRALDEYAIIRLDIVCGKDAAAAMRTARERGGWKAAITMASLLGDTCAWAAAMTAHFGPTGTHESWLDANGCPNAECLAKFPEIGERMAKAAERWENTLASNERRDEKTGWNYVVSMHSASYMAWKREQAAKAAAAA